MASKLQTIAEPQHRLTSEDIELLKQIQDKVADDLSRVCKELSRWRDYYDEIFDIASIDVIGSMVYVIDEEDQTRTSPLNLFTYSNSELHKYVDEKIKADVEAKKRYQERNKERRRKQYEELKKEFESS